MDKIISDEERLRRAEAVAERRLNKQLNNNCNKNKIEKSNSKTKILLIQILVCLLIYCGFYYVKKLPEDNKVKRDVTDKINWILNSDVDFKELYKSIFYKDNHEKNEENESDTNIILEENNQINTDDISSEVVFNYGVGGELSDNSMEDVDNFENDTDVSYIKFNIPLTKPVKKGVVTSRFGERESSEIVSANHKGVDIGAPNGTEILSASDGNVLDVSTIGDFGKHIKIKNGDFIFIYGHCSKLLVSKGDEIKMGQKIGEVGSTGRATGPHLHFEIRKGEKSINPELVMNFDN